MDNNVQTTVTEAVEVQENTNQVQDQNNIEQPKEQPQKKKSSEILRDISKEISINLFEEDGIDKLRTKMKNDREQLDKLSKQIESYATIENEYKKKEELLNKKMIALKEGFKYEDLDEVLALVQVNTREGVPFDDTLKAVKTKWYGNRSQPAELGLNFSDVNNVETLSDKDRYFQNNPVLKAFYDKQNKKK